MVPEQPRSGGVSQVGLAVARPAAIDRLTPPGRGCSLCAESVEPTTRRSDHYPRPRQKGIEPVFKRALGCAATIGLLTAGYAGYCQGFDLFSRWIGVTRQGADRALRPLPLAHRARGPRPRRSRLRR